MAEKRNRVPNVLWKIFGSQTRTLAETIISLVAWLDCHCEGRRCLGCVSGKNVMSFLLKPDDSTQYRNLLTQCFVVVSDKAPPLLTFDPHNTYPQLQLVERTIKHLKKLSPPNVICSDYKSYPNPSVAVKLLTSAEWSLLLLRIGDQLMLHLLMHTSIFVPLPCKKYQQVAGSSIIKFCPFSVKQCTNSEHQGKKRKNTKNDSKQVKKQKVDSPKIQRYHTPNNCEESLHDEGKGGIVLKSRKRFREYKNVRQKKRKLLASQESNCGEVVDADLKTLLQCSCCFVFKNLKKILSTKVLIDRRNMFYKLGNSSSVLPSNHILYLLRSNIYGADILFNDIFGIEKHSCNSQKVCSHCSDSCLSGSTCLYHSLIKNLKILIRNSRFCNFSKLLEKHCKIQSSDNISNLSNSHCLKKQVVSFIWAVCRSIIPADLLGTPSNWRNLRRNIFKFIKLRRFEKFSLKQCMHKLKSSSFPFLSKNKSWCYDPTVTKRTIIESWIFWLFSCIVIPLVQTNFYATESEYGRQEVFYYKKSTWKNIMDESVVVLKDKNYKRLTNSELIRTIKNRSFGFSRIRIRPKGNGIRALANLRAPSNFKNYKRISVNSVLSNCHIVLKGIQMKEPEKLGSSVFDYNDVYRKIRPFLSNLDGESRDELYVVVSDVSKAFDTVDQDKLISVMNGLISNNEYVLKKSLKVVCMKKSLQVQKNLRLDDKDSRFSSSFSRSQGGIFVDQDWRNDLKRKDLLHILNQHLKGNVLQLNKQFYLQNVGIPQGSILSSLLCSFYLADLEKNRISPFLEMAMNNDDRATSSSFSSHPAKYVLFRFIDDFLFVSTSKDMAKKFFTKVNNGFTPYNCHMNKTKFGSNFDLDEIPSNRVYVGKDGVSFVPWSGLFINCRSLELQADYTRYLNTHLRSTLTVRWDDKPGQHLKLKLRSFLRPKCHPIFYDSKINSASVVRLNIFQAFLICAMKFHCYVEELSDVCRFSPEGYMGIILKSTRYMYKLIKRRMSLIETEANSRPKLQVEKVEVEWLGLVAFNQVLRRKQTRYKELLILLKIYMKVNKNELRKMNELLYAINRSHSSVLWEIKY